MNLFKKLCKQNQKLKYNVMHQYLNDFTKQHARLRREAQEVAVAAHVAAVASQQSTEAIPQSTRQPSTRHSSTRRVRT